MTERFRLNPQGVREFGNSTGLSSAMARVASEMAATANATGQSTYASRAITVTAGRDNESRAGAEVYERERHSRDVRARHLVQISKTFRMRGGG